MSEVARPAKLVGRDALIWGVGSFLILRIVSSAAAAWSLRFLPSGEHVQVPGYVSPVLSGTGRWLGSVWLRSDALWYLRAAEQGYGADLQGYAFYPAYPLLTRVFAFVLGNELIAGLLVASLCAAIGLVLLYALIDATFGAFAAKAGTLGFAVFPTSFFLVAPYAESMLVALGCGALLLAIKGKGLPALFLGFLAGLTRPFGILLSIPLLAIGLRRKSTWLVGAAPVVGSGFWFAIVGIQTGDPLAALSVQGMWQREPTFFPVTIVLAIGGWMRWIGNSIGPYFLADLLALVFSVLLVAAFFWSETTSARMKSIRIGLTLYGAALVIFVLSSPFLPRPLLSLPRFVLALFPLFGAYGWFSKNRFLRLARWPALGVSVVGLAIGTAVFVAGRPLF